MTLLFPLQKTCSIFSVFLTPVKRFMLVNYVSLFSHDHNYQVESYFYHPQHSCGKGAGRHPPGQALLPGRQTPPPAGRHYPPASRTPTPTPRDDHCSGRCAIDSCTSISRNQPKIGENTTELFTISNFAHNAALILIPLSICCPPRLLSFPPHWTCAYWLSHNS